MAICLELRLVDATWVPTCVGKLLSSATCIVLSSATQSIQSQISLPLLRLLGLLDTQQKTQTEGVHKHTRKGTYNHAFWRATQQPLARLAFSRVRYLLALGCEQHPPQSDSSSQSQPLAYRILPTYLSEPWLKGRRRYPMNPSLLSGCLREPMPYWH
jgi:hypothetical protein